MYCIETWLDSELSDSEVNISRYRVFKHDRNHHSDVAECLSMLKLSLLMTLPLYHFHLPKITWSFTNVLLL